MTAIVTREDGRVLVIKRADDGRWVPPGGVLDLGETPQEGCAREVLEETGYRIDVGPCTGVYKNMELGVVSLAFRCTLGGMAEVTTSGVRVKIEIWYDRESRKIIFSNVDKDFGPKGLIGSFIPGSAAEKRAQELLERHGKLHSPKSARGEYG